MKKIKIGQIGICHEHASGKIGAFRKMPDVYEIVGVVDDRDTTAAHRFAGDSVEPYEGLTWMTEEELLLGISLSSVGRPGCREAYAQACVMVNILFSSIPRQDWQKAIVRFTRLGNKKNVELDDALQGTFGIGEIELRRMVCRVRDNAMFPHGKQGLSQRLGSAVK